MPIRLLKNIKLKRPSCSQYTKENNQLRRILTSRHVLGAYVFSCKDLNANQPLFNDGIPSLIFMPRQTDAVRLKGDTSVKTLKSTWICCGIIQNTHWEIPEGLEYIFIIRLKPVSFYSLFGIDIKTLQSTPICSLEDVAGGNWNQIINQVYQKQSIEQKAEFLNEVFSSHKIEDYLPCFLQEAVDYIEEKKGNLTIENLLTAFKGKINARWLHRNFVKYIGISPKKYISLQRFIYAYGTYESERAADLSALALRSGYYDYYHFFKEFKQFIGTAPTQYTWE